MTPSLADHFSEQRDTTRHQFERSEIRLISTRDQLVSALAVLLETNKSDPSVTSRLLTSLGWSVALAPLQPGRDAVRRGDFGEMLAAEAAVAYDGSIVPVRKLRYQIDPNQTLPGSDVVAFVIDDDYAVINLNFIEAKYRNHPSSGLAVEAYQQIIDDRAQGYPTTLNFIAHRLSEIDPILFASFLRFLEVRQIVETFATVSLSFDAAHWKEATADQLDDLPDLNSRTSTQTLFSG